MKLSSRTALLAITSAMMLPATAQDAIPLMDFYTVDQRYTKNKDAYPEIEWPVLEFTAGQTVSFDRLYKEEDGRKLHVDVFGPTDDARNGMAVILVHGGAWRSGNKSHMFPLANLLSQRGYTVFTPEYRLSAEAPYPTGMVDLSDLIVCIKENAPEFGIDPDAIALGGGSSGGHMAALLAFSADTDTFKSNPEDDTRVAALIDMDGVLDLTSPEALKYENYAKEKSGIGMWVGGAYETATDLWEEANPVTHLTEDAPPS
ncbi:MAG: esterase, partial [Ponticaulis sp.]|nr:esterase [Ponticaulis sp.]